MKSITDYFDTCANGDNNQDLAVELAGVDGSEEFVFDLAPGGRVRQKG